MSLERFDALLASMLHKACICVSGVPGVPGVPGVSDGSTGVTANGCGDAPTDDQVPNAFIVAGRYTDTQVTRLHEHDGADDEAARLERAAVVEDDGVLPWEIADEAPDQTEPPPGYTALEWSDAVDGLARLINAISATSVEFRVNGSKDGGVVTLIADEALVGCSR
jgi:hypothetical protein